MGSIDMKSTKRAIIIFIFICAVSYAAHAFYWYQVRQTDALQVFMLNIGQGDAFYIRTPNGNDLLIDGGPDRTLLHELGAVMPAWDHSLEWVIATHPDSDHVTGIVELGDSYTVETLITNGDTKKTAASQALTQFAQTTPQHTRVATAGDRMLIEPDLWITFLSPASEYTFYDSNDLSLVFTLQYKNSIALFTGDASEQVEKTLYDSPLLPAHVDLLKVSHHGSKTATSRAFLQAITPTIALISAGKENRYGHPHAAPLYRLRQINAEIWRTDQQGRVRCVSNGTEFTCAHAE